MKDTCYIKIVMVVVFLLLAFTVFFNWLVNPYDIYSAPIIKNFNFTKTQVTSHLRLAKAIAVESIKPAIIIAGSSTAETGLDPKNNGFKYSPVYNLGLSGANIYEVMRYIQHAESIGHLKQVILLVNFFMFNANLPNRVDFDENVLKVDSNGDFVAGFGAVMASTLLSYDALQASVHTIQTQNQPTMYLPNGQVVWDYRDIDIKRRGGYHNNFLYAESYLYNEFLPPPTHSYAFVNSDTGQSSLLNFKKILDVCRQNDINIIVIIAPEHVRLLEVYYLLNLWPQYEKWKRSMVELVEENNEENLKKPQNYIWDFSGYNHYSEEAPPKKNDISTAMHWFWDDFHFKTALGDLILNRIFNKGKDPSFGVILTLRNIPEELNKVRIWRKKWESRDPTEVVELKEILREKK